MMTSHSNAQRIYIGFTHRQQPGTDLCICLCLLVSSVLTVCRSNKWKRYNMGMRIILQRAHDVYATWQQRWCYDMTLHRSWYEIVSISCVRWNRIGSREIQFYNVCPPVYQPGVRNNHPLGTKRPNHRVWNDRTGYETARVWIYHNPFCI